jgi:hypothetical protein
VRAIPLDCGTHLERAIQLNHSAHFLRSARPQSAKRRIAFVALPSVWKPQVELKPHSGQTLSTVVHPHVDGREQGSEYEGVCEKLLGHCRISRGSFTALPEVRKEGQALLGLVEFLPLSHIEARRCRESASAHRTS